MWSKLILISFMAALFCLKQKIKPGTKEILAGAGTGACIGAGTMFGMRALMELPGIVYFPSLSVGNLLLSSQFHPD